MRLLTTNEMQAVAGGQEGSAPGDALAATTEQAKETCGEGNVVSVKVKFYENGNVKSTSFSCKEEES